MNPSRSYHTRQRNLVYDFFRSNPDGCFAVRDLLECHDISVGTATIYRTLSKLVEEGKLKKFSDSGGNGAYYQLNASETCQYHFHLKCIRCGALIHMDCEMMEELQKHIAKDHGFTVDSGKSILYGLCSGCR